jgi:uncharacterized protein
MMYSTIKEEMTAALRAGDSKLLGVLKLIYSELGYAQVEHREGVLPDEEVVKVLLKEAKKRREAIEIYEKANSPERVAQEKYELSIIEKYLPKMMSEEDAAVEIAKIAAETGLTGGRLTGAVMAKLRGKADGGVINRIIQQKYP